ncbi:MAG: hypothetical protein ACREA2_19395 [Blastocatellia bacterium]
MNARIAYWGSFVTTLIALAAFGITWYQLIELRPPLMTATAQNLRRDEESRKKQNPVTISQYMGKPYTQGSIQEVLEKMIHEGTAIDLYWEKDVWNCNWERHGKKYRGQGLDPEDAIADALGKSLPAETPAK